MGEYVLLLAALEVRLDAKKRFSCFKCGTSYKPENIKAFRKPKGCYDYVSRAYKVENIIYKSCLGNYNIDIAFYVEAFSFYEKGMLPFKGTLSDQPAKVIDIFNIIEQRRKEKAKD